MTEGRDTLLFLLYRGGYAFARTGCTFPHKTEGKVFPIPCHSPPSQAEADAGLSAEKEKNLPGCIAIPERMCYNTHMSCRLYCGCGAVE